MFKWFKIVKSQYLGFWAIGLLLFAIQEIPYMIMPLLHLETNPIMDMPTKSLFLDICEKIFGILCVAVMVLIVHKDNKLFSLNSKSEIAFFTIAVGLIVFNFIGWILYFCGMQSVAIVITFLFALPPLYYLFIGLWRKNYFLTAVGAIFFVIHLANAFTNLL
ncbi:MAG: hypothetical protein K2N23_01715 [Clostridia bacterium]|nr:hypothetical protein [Clostridia bacterium]